MLGKNSQKKKKEEREKEETGRKLSRAKLTES